MGTNEAVRLGSAVFSMVEPERGHARDFHRWYERDHFYAGMMAGPDLFAGRRWVATRALKALRYPAASPLADDVSAGSYAVTYWILDGRHDAFVSWAVKRVHELYAQGRMFRHARQVHTGFYAFRAAAARDADGVPPELALDHPYAGLVALVVDGAADLERLCDWLQSDQLPGSPAGQCLLFAPLPLPEGAPANTPRIESPPDRALLLYFLDADPQAGWTEWFAPAGAALEGAGLGRVVYAAPFIPTVPGTDRYADELW